jgi:hypothetical protein
MNKEKYVDESWKEQASEEKEKPEAPEAQEAEGEQEVEVNFLNYVTSLGFQAMIFLGAIPHPATNQTEKNLTQAKFLIDTLGMLKEKTVGNLNDQEGNLLESSIYELQMKYVQAVQAQAGTSEPS